MQDIIQQQEQLEVFEEDDFVTDSWKAWGLSEEDFAKVKFYMIGKPMRPQQFSEKELRRGGWSSWREYEAHAAIRAW